MKVLNIIFAAAILFLSVFSLAAQESDVVYTEGWVDIKDSSGEIYELYIGDRVYYGDTVITGDDGVAELEPENGSRIIIKPGTVFSISERDIGGKKQSVVSTTLGEVAFKFNRMTTEPLISTPSTVMGVRGTEFTVYAGADGSSLVAVDSGAVEVSSHGEAVLLEEAEGVEVPAGMPPGEKFPVMEGKINFEQWNTGKIDVMLSDPQAALDRLAVQLEDLAVQMENWAKDYESARAELDKLRDKQKQLVKDGKVEEAREFNEKRVSPFEFTTSRLVLNYRYYALSALSLRQHVFSGFYIRMKTRYIMNSDNPDYVKFLEGYAGLINLYEQRIQPYLVTADY